MIASVDDSRPALVQAHDKFVSYLIDLDYTIDQIGRFVRFAKSHGTYPNAKETVATWRECQARIENLRVRTGIGRRRHLRYLTRNHVTCRFGPWWKIKIPPGGGVNAAAPPILDMIIYNRIQ